MSAWKKQSFLKPPKKQNDQQKRIYCDPYSIKAQPSFYSSKKLLCRFKSVSMKTAIFFNYS
ncbi:hypothetical protein E5L47_00060 [Helicobacter pylori]|nr:hypothetical protein E5L47_00060 [Helicobacter pylori]